jgi:hypothetical protein
MPRALMPRALMPRALLLALAAAGSIGAATPAAAPDPDQIIRKSVAAIKWDWEQAPKYSYLERDVESKRHSPLVAKTYRVVLIDGSPYNLVTALNDQPLSSGEQAEEQRKLQREIEKRHNESEREREKRIAKYTRERMHDHEMLQEMVDAFQFHLTGEAQVNGRSCWVLDAEPRPGYEATNHEGRVLKGMKGQLWIDKATNQWVKVHAEVVKPVSFYGFLAKVGPGTAFDLEQAPAMDNVWMPTRFDVRVNSTALGFFSESSTKYDTYRDYQPMPQASALLQSTK